MQSLPTGIYMVIFYLSACSGWITILVTCILGFVAAMVLYVFCYVWCDGDMLVHCISNQGDAFAHGESGEDCADSKSVDVTEDEAGKGCGRCKADHVK